MTVVQRSPQELLPLFRRQLETILAFLAACSGSGEGREHEWAPPVDCYETTTGFAVEVEVPGLDSSDLSVSICGALLAVQGMKVEERRSGETCCLRLERHFGRFVRTLEIPPGFDPEQASARCDRGVLTIVFPRFALPGISSRAVPIE